MSTTVKIFENCVRTEELALCDPTFFPLDWTHNPFPAYRELAAILHLHNSGRFREADYVGIVSPKFGSKTKLTGARFVEFILGNPGYDVYFVNPFPQDAYYSFNVWEHGEAHHPGICDLADAAFAAAGYPLSVGRLGRNDKRTLLYSNYWVGSSDFWDRYISFVGPVFDAITQAMQQESRRRYFRVTPHSSSETPMFPFIFERLFSTFLLEEIEIKALGYDHSLKEVLDCCVHDMQREIVQRFKPIIDHWDQCAKYSSEARAIFNGLLAVNCKYAELYWQSHQYPF